MTQFHENINSYLRNVLWMAKMVIKWCDLELFPLHFGPAVGQKGKFAEWIQISTTVLIIIRLTIKALSNNGIFN